MFRLFRGKREALKKWLLAAFLGIMALGMIGVVTPFFSGGDNSQMQMNTLAEVGGSAITTRELQQSIQRLFRNTRQSYDAKLVPALASTILDDLVLSRVLSSQARKLGLEVTDQELLRSLRSIPWVYSNGTFLDPDAYRNVVEQQTGLSVREFEAQFRESLLMEKIRAVVTDGVQVTPEEVRQEFLRRNAKAKIEYVLFDSGQFSKAVPVTPPALEEFLKKNPGRYKVPEQRRVRYVIIDADRIRAQVKLDEEELKQYYNQHLGDYRVEDRVKIAHVLFKTTGKTPAEVATIEKTAREVLAQAKSGANFGELAKKNSEDSSAANGGEIGWIVRGQTVKEFEDAAFSMKPGQVSDLIKTTYGIHVLKVLDKQSAHLQTFEEVKDSIRAELERQRLAAAQQSLTDDLERQVKANPKNFEAVARKAGLETKETSLFRYNQPIPDFGNSEAFANLAFELRMGEAGGPITVPKGMAIIQLTEVVPEHPPKPEEVRAQVEQDYRSEESKNIALEKAQDFAAKCKTGDFKKLAKAASLTVKESKDFAQQDYVEGLASGSSLAAAFALPPGQGSDVVPVGVNNVVFRVLSHTPANEADFPTQRDRIREDLSQRKRAQAFEIFRQNLKQELLRTHELKMNDAGMQQFLALYRKP